MDLEGRIAVVTGGTSGIGAGVVAHLRAAGATPVVWDLEAGPGTDHIAVDVSDPVSVADALGRTVAEWGAPSVLVASAGIGAFAPIGSIDLDGWRRVFDVNVTGTMLCVQAVAGAMRTDDLDGSIVCVSSINGRIADRGMAAYCCSKAAVDMLVRVAAAELGPAGIRVNAVAPGVTDTPLFAQSAGRVPGLADGVAARTSLGRVGSADDIAEAVLALVRADWITGQSVLVDGGLSLHSPIDIWSTIDPT